MTTASVPNSDRRPMIALALAILAVAASLTFFWMYAVPPLLFAIPAGLLVRQIYIQHGALPRRALIAGALLPVAVVCDVAFLLINIHHLY
jgi:hypothetical protein